MSSEEKSSHELLAATRAALRAAVPRKDELAKTLDALLGAVTRQEVMADTGEAFQSFAACVCYAEPYGLGVDTADQVELLVETLVALRKSREAGKFLDAVKRKRGRAKRTESAISTAEAPARFYTVSRGGDIERSLMTLWTMQRTDLLDRIDAGEISVTDARAIARQKSPKPLTAEQLWKQFEKASKDEQERHIRMLRDNGRV